MIRSPSFRLARVGVVMFFCGVAMLAAAIATGASHGPKVLSGIFLVLMVLCAVAGFILVRVAAGKMREENARLVAEAQAQARANRK